MAPTEPPSAPPLAVSEGLYAPVMSRALLAPRYWPTWLGLGLLRALQLLPRLWVAALGVMLGDILYSAHRKRRQIVRTNISLCFPEISAAAQRRLVRRHYHVLVQSMLDYGLLWWGSRARLETLIQVRGLEHYRQAQQQGRAVIVLTGHFVALEMGAALLSMHFPQIGLVKPAKNALLDYYVTRGRTRFLGRLFLRKKGMLPVVRALQQGYGFYYLPDEDHGEKKSMFVPFFAAQAATLGAPSKLASLCNAVVIPSYTRRLPKGQGYELVFREPLADFPSGDDLRDARRMRQQLELSIREDPAQYMWTFKLFKTQPDDQPSPYGCRKRRR